MNLKEIEQLEIRLSGSGGQGLVLASIICADILISLGYNVIQGESHGIEARGGASRGEVIGRKDEITDQAVKHPDVFVALTQKSCNKYYKDIKEDALVILDSFLITEIPDFKTENIYLLPFTKRVKEELGTVLPTNIASIGAIAALTDLADYELYKEAIKNRVPAGTVEMNMKAFELGMQMANESLK
ncbi:MAG TPA: 2-oxoacid:acceptor oxidoreductase family protein [Halanaerobiales bacterium]|nr:2-oxoacid:acceptor oxidoreductase family protein [Halanaerobiales bacterium]